MNAEEDSEYSVYVGNLDCTVPVADLEELLYELFLQVSTVCQLMTIAPFKLHALII